MRPITSDLDLMKEDFASKLPKHLGEPYIMNTLTFPVVFVAFFPGQRHEMRNGEVVYGNELRLLDYHKGFKPKKMLAAVIGAREDPPDIVLMALTCQGTRKSEIKPFGRMIREMLVEATT